MLLQIYLADLDDNFHHLKSWSSGPGLIFFCDILGTKAFLPMLTSSFLRSLLRVDLAISVV